jgi:hypothetical protein
MNIFEKDLQNMKKRRAKNVAEMPDYDHLRVKISYKNSILRLNTTKYLESVIRIKPVSGTTKHNSCTRHNRTILTFQSKTQHNSTTAVVPACTIDKIRGSETQLKNTIFSKKIGSKVFYEV